MVHTMKSEEFAPGKRRHHERSFKADLILQSLVPGASVSAIALAAGINANLLFKWRRDHLRAMRAPTAGAVTLLPVQLAPAIETAPLATTTSSDGMDVAKSSPSDAHDGIIEVDFAGARLRVHSSVDEKALMIVLRALRRSA
jgi:transposase